jgi:peptidoglycan/LPS O-acetylase OafA/YrhL
MSPETKEQISRGNLLEQTAIRQSATKRRNLDALTGLRFFAAFAVVIYHFARPALTGWPTFLQNLAGSGYVAVDFFFVLSGFVLSYSYLKQNGSITGAKSSFYVARFARIYPAYLLAFLLAAPTNIMLSLHVNHLGTAIVKLLSSAVAVLTLQQAWTPWTAWAWNFPAWSISVEAFFYVLFPFAGPALARLRVKACLIAFCLSWAAALVPPLILYVFRGTHGAPQLSDRLQMAVEFTPLLRLPEFLAGILLGRLYVLGFASRRLKRVFSYAGFAGVLLVLAFSSAIPHPLLSSCFPCSPCWSMGWRMEGLGWSVSFPCACWCIWERRVTRSTFCRFLLRIC